MFKVDYLDDGVYTWQLTEEGVEYNVDSAYEPTVYASTQSSLDDLAADVRTLPYVTQIRTESYRTAFRNEPEQVLRIGVERIDDVTRVAHRLHQWGDPGEHRLYNVDFSREFRYCLENGVCPAPNRELSTLEIGVDPVNLANDDLSTITIDGQDWSMSVAENLEELAVQLRTVDPDVLIVSSADIVPVVTDVSEEVGVDLQFGRVPGYQQLASESSYESYGRVGHSPARYNVPGRCLIDRSNTFFLNETNLDGCLDLVRRSWKPLQELSWASIGNVLTGIQIREAIDRGVLVPWKSWRHEQLKTATQLHEADRGGFIFSPSVGVHDDVHELDFSSLYPNIICEYNISPDKIRCECHAGREDVPGLGYSVCDEQGYLVDVLQPLIDDRDEIKAAISRTSDPDRLEELEGRSSAIKWILVSCFGYQGFSNAKFGRIECHEAINAYAREILLDAKEALEAAGWRVVHGIVDSIWVTPRDEADQRSLAAVAEEVTADVGIRLEYERAYDWIAFVPQRRRDAGALTKYFGRAADAPEYKYRGIECRQRSTPEYIAAVQEELVELFDSYREPEPVCDRVASAVEELQAGDVDPDRLLIDTRTSKSVDAYGQYTRTVSALERSQELGREILPGQHVNYVVVDDSKTSRERVALASESITDYDAEFYAELVIRAAGSILSPIGWRQEDIADYLSDTSATTISRFTQPSQM